MDMDASAALNLRTPNLRTSWLEAPRSDVSCRVAIVLNARAKGVTSDVIREVRNAVTDETLYISYSLEQAEFIARHVVNSNYDLICCGGGDGTFCRIVSDVTSLQPKQTPTFAVLRLGTGNAMAEALGFQSGAARLQLTDARHAMEQQQVQSVPLLNVDGQLTPFAGLGLDAVILQDYQDVRAAFGAGPLRVLGRGAMGYGLAVATRSLWRYLGDQLPEVVIRNEGAPVQRIDSEGRLFGRPIKRGETIYDGPVTIASASTIPYFGMGMKFFPQATRQPRRFQLRVGKVGPVDVLSRLRRLFDGTFASEVLWDFACSAISIQAKHPTSVQVGGDLLENQRSLSIDMRWINMVGG